MKLPAIAVLVVVFAPACSRSSPPPPETLDPAFAADVRRRADEQDAIRRDVLAKAEDAVVPREDLGECPNKTSDYHLKTLTEKKERSPIVKPETFAQYDVAPWDAGRRKDSEFDVLGSNWRDDMMGISKIGIAQLGEVADKPGPRWFRLYSETKGAMSEYQRKSVQDELDPSKDAFDYELVIIREMPPKMKTATEFEAGLLLGRFYVYDHAKRAIVCAARVLVESSANLRFRQYSNDEASKKQTRDATMLSDLREQALVQGAERLVVAGPPAGASGDAGAPDGGGDAGSAKRRDAGLK
jgi:hypothetical protein